MDQIYDMRNKMPVNEKFFDTWNEYSAYVFGYWWADGNLYIVHMPSGARKYARINIASKDIDHLQTIADLMGWKGIIKIRQQTMPSGYVSIVGRMDLSNNYMADRLLEMGGRCRKSHCDEMPTVPTEYLHHFIRGLYDGDGGICWKRYKSRHGKQIKNLTTYFSAGSELFLERLCSLLHEQCGTGRKKVVRTSDKGWKLSFNQHDSALLCNWMYREAAVWMKRKKEIWDGADKQKLLNSKKYFSNKV